ncbi:translation elongation factor Ts [Candidatus Falkowbacteria bacterium RIFOXYD2_FULL_35_9]|uniref:Elongation factor Ts n=1 Tax=Candidatus Falkowbacteria bacterium RIFOXYC2_FULL_36_12 TaxID=1798002 RepID=A0A1F5SVW3_9BACT|nr:MAG: translation elongation factor Ts [Candidatus Falkowbacteria bacterium RIFOXYC2_FULL_36_12]OGF31458.1 MAG: translation elongation factor Ts [Candidatus Falkowbacteria bacterium RIFOXYB2_FULL_35_7]OGF34256.1 MAG: translation elongation factor Ts [Candidatus Falkowbacteria bacterium RIFOXYA2_FULL_35_8]OGF46971.1 MAG: translation elongation factor Ts [Candidatus Falkowbacteria bacterium RIFOXYD2_FULL_35_9]
MVDVQTIQKLRRVTGAGMVDCKNALDEANENFDLAIEILRKKGEAKAAKKADRTANEGLVSVARADGKVAVVALNCETDFVARNEDFIKAGQDLAQSLIELSEAEFKTKSEEKIKNELIVKIGENIKLGEFGVYTGEVIGVYLHSNKKVAAVVILDGGSENVAVDIAMQAVAMAPEYLVPEDVPAEILAKEKEILAEQMKNEGKPAEMVEKIVGGKINKFYEENCLLKQAFIKDDKISVEKYLENVGNGAKIVAFHVITL